MDEITVEIRFFKSLVRLWFATPDMVPPSVIKARLDRFAPAIKTRLIAGDYEGNIGTLLDNLGQLPNIRAAQILVDDQDDPDIRRGFLRHYVWP